MNPEQKLAQHVKRVEAMLQKILPDINASPARLHEAMHYAVFPAGKRIRPQLCYATTEALEVDKSIADGPAMAIELIHCYSLVHDDLPAMDDDDLRRGRPTCHIAFGEATAILAGDALQALAFEALCQQNSPNAARMCLQLAQACGSTGMAGGQQLDLDATGQSLEQAQLENIHALKTGALIKACIQLPLIATDNLDSEKGQRLSTYAELAGLAFQVRDDLLDREGSTMEIGKTAGSDAAAGKNTYADLLGMKGARTYLEELKNEMLAEIAGFGTEAELMRYLAHNIVTRSR